MVAMTYPPHIGLEVLGSTAGISISTTVAQAHGCLFQ